METQEQKNKTEEKYLGLVAKCILGEERISRNGITRGLFAKKLSFKVYDAGRGKYMLPLLTTKKMGMSPIHWELLWFMRGDTNIKYLNDHGVKIWDANADPSYLASRGLNYPTGELGPVYGAQWRNWKTANGAHIDQLSAVIKSLREDPMSRRHIVSSWNVGELDSMALPPCHWAYQFYMCPRGCSILVHMRSGDICLGVPYNLVSYTMLLYIISSILGVAPYKVVITFGDLHIYEEHIENAKIQCVRDIGNFPTVTIAPEKHMIGSKKIEKLEDALELTPGDWGLANYSPGEAIKYEMKA